MDVHEWDAALADPAVDHAALAARLNVDTDDMQRAARVREVLLAGRAADPEQETDLSADDLRTANINSGDIAAYMRVVRAINNQRHPDTHEG